MASSALELPVSGECVEAAARREGACGRLGAGLRQRSASASSTTAAATALRTDASSTLGSAAARVHLVEELVSLVLELAREGLGAAVLGLVHDAGPLQERCARQAGLRTVGFLSYLSRSIT